MARMENKYMSNEGETNGKPPPGPSSGMQVNKPIKITNNKTSKIHAELDDLEMEVID